MSDTHGNVVKLDPEEEKVEKMYGEKEMLSIDTSGVMLEWCCRPLVIASIIPMRRT